jgi:hypothetical protein
MKPLRPTDLTHAEPVDGRGRGTPATRLLIDERDALLIEAAKFYPGASDREIARQIRIAVSRYRDGRWRRDSSEATCPVQHRGKLTAVLWAILKVRDAPPPSVRTITAVLSRL